MRLRAVSEKIDKLQAALPQPVDPRLANYLQTKNYDKALEFLEGQIIANKLDDELFVHDGLYFFARWDASNLGAERVAIDR